MKMNKLKYLLYMCAASIVCLFVATSCITDDLGDDTPTADGNEHVTVNMTFQAKDAGIATDASNPENQLKSIRVYVFDSDETDANLLGYHYVGLGDQTVTATYKFSIKLDLRKDQLAQNCWFYIIANEGYAGGLQLADGSSFTFPEATWDDTNEEWNWEAESKIAPTDFPDLRFTQLPEYGTDGSPLPMAVAESRSIASMGQKCEFVLQRSVAKLNLYFARYGTGQAFMGRGMYLYNIPEYGFLFPKAGDFTVETTNKENKAGDNSDSPNQNGGKVILPAGAKTAADETDPTKIDINEITKDVSKLQGGSGNLANYELIPNNPVYLYAHPQGKDKGEDVLDDEENTDGYQLKILVHLHEVDEDGDRTDHTGEIYNVYLPKVQANHAINVLSVFRMKSYIEIPYLHWMILPWNQKGGDIVFE